MKTFIASLICFIVLAGLLFVFLWIVDSDIDDLIEEAQNLEEEIYHENWAQAEEEYKEFSKEWLKEKKKMGYFLEQADLETVTENVAALESYIKNKSTNEALARLSVIKMRLSVIKQNEYPTPVNIF